jgi:hypothetical protein
MKGIIATFLFTILVMASSCNDCSNCEPFTQEPFLTIRFLNKADSSQRIIIIDSLNSIYAKDVRQFQDTTYEYKFPLDMHHDTSVFQMVYRDTSDLENYLTNKVTLTYLRQFLRRDDNYIIVECTLDNFYTDFGSEVLICKDDSEMNCISNEATAKIYN